LLTHQLFVCSSDNELLTIGERVTNIERLMNNQYGADEELGLL
jgi:hypothetical protein